MLLVLSLLLGCNPADLGDVCTTDEDCGPDYVCHMEPGADEGVCDECHHGEEGCTDGDEHTGEEH